MYFAYLTKLIYKSSKEDEDVKVNKESATQAWRIIKKLKFCPCVTIDGEVNKEELEANVTVFLGEIDKRGHESVGREILGGCFAYAFPL